MSETSWLDDGAGNYYQKNNVETYAKPFYLGGYAWVGIHTGTIWRSGLQNDMWANTAAMDDVFGYHFNSDRDDVYFAYLSGRAFGLSLRMWWGILLNG